jgi:HNH endonuclease
MVKDLTQEELKSVLHYDSDTGLFTWKRNNHNRHRIGCRAGGFHKTTGYINIRINTFQYQAHRLVWFYVYGVWPIEVDHEDHDRANNKLNNLRATTHMSNGRNRSLNKNNKSGYNGVRMHKRSKKWSAYIRNDGKNIHLGSFFLKGEAIEARRKANIKYGYHENHGSK